MFILVLSGQSGLNDLSTTMLFFFIPVDVLSQEERGFLSVISVGVLI